MATLIPLELDPDAPTLRRFGALALLVFGALAACAWLELRPFSFGLGEAREPVAAALLALGGVSGALSLVYPRGNRPLFVALCLAGYPFGLALSYAVLALLFFAVFTPVGLLLRLRGIDPMQRRFEPERASYFEPVPPRRDKASYFRQF